jgi:hypothetical protein
MTAANDSSSNMAKTGLGRGLQHLMKERSASPASETPAQKAEVSPGMAALLRGGNGAAKALQNGDNTEQAEGSRAARRRKRLLIQTSLFAADILVIGLVARLAFVSHGRFGLFEISLSIVALAIGAWLSCLALWLK